MRNSIFKMLTYFIVLGIIIIISEFQLTRVIALLLLTILIFIELNDIMREFYRERDQKINRHIDEIQKNQSKIERDKTRFLSLIDSMGNGLVLVDIDGKIKYINKDFAEYFGDKEYEGESFEIAIEDEGLTDFIKSAYLKEIKMKSQMESGFKSYELIATPLFQNEVFIGCIILIHDITLLKNSEKMQKAFIADASHELRTPITAIKGMSEILLRDDDIDISTKREFLDIIYNEGGRLELIVEDLMQMSRLERSGVLLKTEQINIHEVSKEVVKSLELEAKKQNLSIINDAHELYIEANRNMIYRLLANLVKNAITYSDKGTITISTHVADNEVTISVKDNGIGIPEEDLNHIFERFYRVDKARARDSGGTGLGLSICKKIVEIHNGVINVHSKVGEGTTFEIVLPKQ